jgi:23S rRNA (guanosine2251-2'-O)-methyltransferase
MHRPLNNLVYGVHAVRGLLLADASRIVSLRISAARDDQRMSELAQLAQQAGINVQRAQPREFEQWLGAEAAHQGVLAEIKPLAPWDENGLLGALTKADNPLLLVLDGVQDPHNLGACLRTANACGALAVVAPKDRAVPMNATVRKVAAGAAEFTPFVSVTNLARSLRLLKDAGLWIVGADAAAPSLAQDIDLKGGIALVLGAEGAGLRQLTRDTCDLLVKLPMAGQVESLNVSVAAAMLLYEARRQRGPPLKTPTRA